MWIESKPDGILTLGHIKVLPHRSGRDKCWDQVTKAKTQGLCRIYLIHVAKTPEMIEMGALLHMICTTWTFCLSGTHCIYNKLLAPKVRLISVGTAMSRTQHYKYSACRDETLLPPRHLARGYGRCVTHHCCTTTWRPPYPEMCHMERVDKDDRDIRGLEFGYLE